MIKKLKAYLAIMALSIVTLLQGCAVYKENVKLDGEAALEKYAQSENGDFEFIDYEEDADSNTHTLTVKDKDTGLIYQVSSYPAGMGGSIDGEWFAYKKRTQSNYKYEYTLYIARLMVAELEADYGIGILEDDYPIDRLTELDGRYVNVFDKYYVGDSIYNYIADMEAIQKVGQKYNYEEYGFTGRYDVYIVDKTQKNPTLRNYTSYYLE